MLGNLTGTHAIVILAVVVLLFGAAKLPQLAKSMGQSMKIFREEVKSPKAEAPVADPLPSSLPTTSTPTPSAPSSFPTTPGTTEIPPKL